MCEQIVRGLAFPPHLIDTFLFVFYLLYRIALLKTWNKWNCRVLSLYLLVFLLLLWNISSCSLNVEKKGNRFEKQKGNQGWKDSWREGGEGLEMYLCSKRSLRMKMWYNVCVSTWALVIVKVNVKERWRTGGGNVLQTIAFASMYIFNNVPFIVLFYL